MRIEERQEKRKERGKKNRIRWNLLLHDPVPIPDGFVIVAEAYQPAFQTRQETITVSDGRGGTRTSTRTYQEFIGWSFSHALVVGFDEEGHHRFDHSLRLSSGLSPTLQEHVRVLPDAHGLTLLYPQHRVLRTARIEGDQLLEEGEPVSLSTDVSVKRNLSADAAWWHDDVFLMHGVDRIGPPRGRARRVFFLSTLELMQ